MIDCITGNGSSTDHADRPGDPELLRRYAEECDECAFGELVQRHLDFVYSAALRRLGGDAHSAADVAQQVFTALARRAATLARGVVLPGWLYATTRRLTADLVRSEHRRRAREWEACTMDELNSTPPSTAEWERLRPMLDQVIDELGESDRNAVVLRFFARRPFADIGAALRITEDAARMRVDRALDKLRTMLAKRGVTSTSAALAAVLANQAVATAPVGLAASVTGAALTGATAAEAVGVATLIAFMTATKTTVVLGIAAVLAVATAVYQSSEARTTAAALSTAEKEQGAAGDRLAELEVKARTAERTLAGRGNSVAQATAQAPATAPNSADGVAAQQKMLKQFLDNHPELRMLRAEATRARLKATNEPFLRSLGLTPEQIEQYVDDAVPRVAWQDAQRLAGVEQPGKLDPSHAGFRTLFGDAAADQFTEYQKAWNEWYVVRKLTADLYYAEEPLTVSQTKRLIEILSSARVARATGEPPVPRLARYDWDRVLAEAAPVLAPAQRQGLLAQAAEVLNYRQLRAAVKRSVTATTP